MNDIEKAIEHFKKRNFRLKANPVCQDIKERVEKQNYEIERNNLAISALEKQTAKKVKRIKINDRNVDFKCPSCNKFVAYEFCLDCGQKLDWEVKNETNTI